MAESSFPYDSGAGAAVNEAQWQSMARRFRQTGVIGGSLNQLAVSADGSALAVSVATGDAFVEGFFYRNDAALALTIAAANATNPRIDTVVVRLDRVANSAALGVVTGTAAASPTAPTLSQTDSLYELPLADVRVPAAAGVIVAADVTDRRKITQTFDSAAYLAKGQNLADVPDKAAARTNLGLAGAASVAPVRASITTQQTGIIAETAITGLSVSITVPAGRLLRVSWSSHIYSTAVDTGYGVNLKHGGTTIAGAAGRAPTANRETHVNYTVVVAPAAGTQTFSLSLVRTEGSGTLASYATATLPAFLLVEDIGAAA